MLELGKTTVQREIAKSRLQSTQTAAETKIPMPKRWISNNRQQAKPGELMIPRSESGMSFAPQDYSKLVSSRLDSSRIEFDFAPQSYSKAVSSRLESSSSELVFWRKEPRAVRAALRGQADAESPIPDRMTQRERQKTLGEIVGAELHRILQKQGFPYQDISNYLDILMLDVSLIFDDNRLATSLYLGFGENPGAWAAAYYEFKALLPKLMDMYLSQEAYSSA